jgi:hypothetical protein
LILSLLPDAEESWKGLVTQLIERVHVALDTVYNGLEDVDHQEQYGACYIWRVRGTNTLIGRIKTEAEAKMLDIEIYERRVRGAVRTIELMFGNKYAFEVELPLRRVFNLMLRVFSVDGSVLVSDQRTLIIAPVLTVDATDSCWRQLLHAAGHRSCHIELPSDWI